MTAEAAAKRIRFYERGMFICEGEYLGVSDNEQIVMRADHQRTPVELFTASPATGRELDFTVEFVVSGAAA